MARSTKPRLIPAAPGHYQSRLVSLLRNLAPREGYNLTALPDVRILRSDRRLSRTPVLYDPGIVIVCQGSKRGYFGDRVYLYDEAHYLAVSMPVPFTMETDATADRPLLAVYLHLNFRTLADLLLQTGRTGQANGVAPQSLISSLMDADFRASLLRFLEALSRPLEATVLGPALVRELYFRVLTGPQGSVLRAALSIQGHFGKIGKALARIHAAYGTPIDIAELASEAGMSVPSFHVHFKAITHTSPMQYLKSTRLHQSRLLMVRESMTAVAACRAVGYGSSSQFNREFKRLFGRTPLEETRRMRASFSLPSAHQGSSYVSSH